MGRLAGLTVAVFVASAGFIGPGEAESPKAGGPVQGYHGGYDTTDKSRAPAAPDGQKTDAGNADEGRSGTSVSGAIAAVEGRNLTLDNGLVLMVPPTLNVDETVLRVGTRITARYDDQGGSHVVTMIRREPS